MTAATGPGYGTRPPISPPISLARLLARQAAAAKAVTDVFHRHGGGLQSDVETAGGLAALLAALPADTPVGVADCTAVDPALAPGAPTVTATVVRAVNLLEPDPVDVVDADGQVRQYGQLIPGVEVGAAIVAAGHPVPDRTIPWPWYERALHALAVGDVDATLTAFARLLDEIADLLTDTPAGASVGPDGVPETVPSWIDDPDLRARLDVQADQLRLAAGRLDTLRRDIGDRERRRATQEAADADEDNASENHAGEDHADVNNADAENAAWVAFLARWHELYGGQRNTTQEIRRSADVDTDDVGRPIDRWAGTFLTDDLGRIPSGKSLGRYLTGHIGRWHGRYVLRSEIGTASKSRVFWVETNDV